MEYNTQWWQSEYDLDVQLYLLSRVISKYYWNYYNFLHSLVFIVTYESVFTTRSANYLFVSAYYFISSRTPTLAFSSSFQLHPEHRTVTVPAAINTGLTGCLSN